MSQLVDRSTAGGARWQVRWKAGRDATGRSQTFLSPLVIRGKSAAQRDAERPGAGAVADRSFRRLAAYMASGT